MSDVVELTAKLAGLEASIKRYHREIETLRERTEGGLNPHLARCLPLVESMKAHKIEERDQLMAAIQRERESHE